MKKKILYYAMLLMGMMISPAIAQIDNLTNLSPEWIKSGARNASTDGTDILAYNPGGMARLKSGFHLNIGNQSFFRKPSHEYDFGYGVQKYEQEGSDPFVPNLYMSYNKDKWALFGGVYVAGGGATANYTHGSVTTDLVSMFALSGTGGAYNNSKDQYLKASSYYLAYSAGGAYSVNDKFSFGVSVRYLSAKNKTEAGVTLSDSPMELPDMPLVLKTEDNASGMGIVAGFNVQPISKLNFAVRYESQVKLDFKTKQIQDDLGITVDGETNRRDLPAVLGLGVSYAMTEKFTVLSDFNYYFQKNADWGTSGELTAMQNWSALAGNASTYALAFDYKFTPKFSYSLGGVYSLFSYADQNAYFTHDGAFETVMDNNFNINTGIGYNVTEKVKFNLGFAKAIYAKDKKVKLLNAYPADVDVTVNNSISTIALGVDLLF